MPQHLFHHTESAGLEIAKALLDIKAVNLRPDQPYMLTSGWASPTYIDCRKVISFPAVRQAIVRHWADIAAQKIGAGKIDAVAGGETAGIPYGAWLAEKMNLPMLYVRKKPKGFGRGAQIEGDFKDGQRVLLVEDMATDGASKVAFVNALREGGTIVTDCFVVFYYGVFPSTGQLESANVNMHYLCDWNDILTVAESGKYFDAGIIARVREFLADPAKWSEAHGGASLETAKLSATTGSKL